MSDNIPRPHTRNSDYPEAPWYFNLIAFWSLTLMLAVLWRKIDISQVLFHLRAGQAVLRSGQIPNSDVFSATSPIGIYVYFDWLWGMALAYAYTAKEWIGINALTLIVGAAILGFCMIRCIRWGARWFESIIITMLVFAALAPTLQATPLMAALPVYLVALLLTEGRIRQWPMILIPAIASLWANIHIGAVLVLLVPIVRAVVPESETLKSSTRISPRFFWIVIAGGILGLLVNPHSFQIVPAWLHATVIQVAQFYISFTVAITEPAFLVRVATVIILILASLVHRTLSRQNIVVATVLVVATILLSPDAINFLILYLAAPAAVALSEAMVSTWNNSRSIKAAASLALLIAVAFWQVTILFATGISPRAFGAGVRQDIFPETAGGRLAAMPLRASIFNEAKDADYLIWRLWPGWKVCIDNRPGLYDSESRDQYKKIWQGGEGWQSMLAMWRAYAVLGSTDISARYPGHNLYDELAKSPDWQAVYWDRWSILYIKRDIDLGSTNLEAFRQLKPGLRWDEMSARMKTPAQWTELASDLRRTLRDDANNYDAIEYLRRTEEHIRSSN